MLLALTQRADRFDILSIFAVPVFQSCIFVEAWNVENVQAACLGLSEVTGTVSRIPLEESVGLLQVRPSFVPEERTWIRIAKPPVYRGDLAFIRSCDEEQEQDKLLVTFMPRIATEQVHQGKRKSARLGTSRKQGWLHRPAQALFNADVAKAVYGEDSVRKENQVFEFQGVTYKNGFVEQCYPLSNFFPAKATPTVEELNIFQSCPDITLADIGLAYFHRIAAGDNVKVVAGQQKGLVGRVKECADHSVVVEYTHVGHPQLSTVSLPTHNVRKRFSVGDQVRVIFGVHRGIVGWVTGELELMSKDDKDLSMLSDFEIYHSTHFVERPKERRKAERKVKKGTRKAKSFPGLGLYDDKSMESVKLFCSLRLSPMAEIKSRSLSLSLPLNSTAQNTVGTRAKNTGQTKGSKNFIIAASFRIP
jgi:ribosomal protein L24